ncbi:MULTISPECIES: DedA family protein [Stutzerimonas stutzeri subgroup]|jgi:membrane protein DedA with SNARE-associated domain|uniref:Membrane protein DedA with SNARE-associated domain n=2 Tax=Stutzerimonas stutzeri subgroup TaxID=578833 RepID=A0A5S5BAE2_STUST|nr:DedA family protein [Stutzerimonas stutzeri]MBK57413.1 DedA family protein [Pseudomonas sp.]MCH2339882.1 DedA family protein [Pseudomonas sp.]MCQ4280569.1 DedA family protein [Stutzerimonas stutzeri]PNF72498.1 DedA family protein [Stutzerimonas stutzeri]TYP64031.1 membrane protein DedA with SNARE-associated domain [Stutzerimonas stutzeri]|tara:strand:+ start:6630 stop:7238 length:609 start_codon:yes stop_codon:yes gene_type:complete
MFDKIVEIVSAFGYIGVFLLMLLENIFPPIPSELIMPLAGFVAARGDLNFIAVILVGTAGSVVGALPWYYAGAKLGQARMKRFAERWGHWLTLSPEDVDKASEWFDRHGKGAVFFGRLIPAVRTLISVPAGIAGMSMTKFLIYSTLGSLIWTALLALAGYLLESQYEKVSEYMNPISTGVVVLMVLYYLYRLIRQRFGRKEH